MNDNKRPRWEIEEIVEMVRLDLYNHGRKYGAQAIREEMESMDVEPLPSISTINRMLSENELTNW